MKKGSRKGGFDLWLVFVNKVDTELMSEALP